MSCQHACSYNAAVTHEAISQCAFVRAKILLLSKECSPSSDCGKLFEGVKNESFCTAVKLMMSVNMPLVVITRKPHRRKRDEGNTHFAIFTLKIQIRLLRVDDEITPKV